MTAANPVARSARTSGRWTVLLVLLVWGGFPIYWMLMTALRPYQELYQRPLPMWPETPTLESFGTVFAGAVPIDRYLLNSVITSSATVVVVLIASLPAAYAFSRMDFPGRHVFFLGIFGSQMVPIVVLLLPLYAIFFRTALLDTYTGLVLGFASFSVPFAVWILKTFIDTIPQELDDAARVDGCSRLQTLRLVITPVMGPGIVAAGALTFLDAWNNLLFPLALTTSLEMKTLPAGMLLAFDGQFRSDWSALMATSLVTAVPVIVLFILCQRWLVGGLTQGSVKG
jgi:multiple sugar transport system permease protein